ncbi:hypothetical protein L596_002886 [Steinernema carpocapsae]|uniref:Ima1 N-terminal domain-containing protein n=1 Tax=Steinernema carpocapsae TaxID=34508 RepID=A0A4V6I7U0_STECR|nr:hypothetical protein L596_002886 [Steinernema carpocapsae]
MDVAWSSISFEVGLAVLLAAASLYFFYTVVRPKFKYRVSCWFCQHVLWVNYKSINAFTCSKCDQYNGFKENGDYNKRMKFRGKGKSDALQYCKRVPEGHLSKGNGLCQQCNENQGRLVMQMNKFEPMVEENFEAELKEYEALLNRQYPLCGMCKAYTNRKLRNERLYMLNGVSKAASSIVSSVKSSIWTSGLLKGSPVNPHNVSISEPQKPREKIKEPYRKRFFGNGFRTNLCYLITFLLSVLFFTAHFDHLQSDSGTLIFDLHLLYPVFVLHLLPSIVSYAKWISLLAFALHCFGMYCAKTRVVLSDLLGIGGWFVMLATHFVTMEGPDGCLSRLAVASVLCITSASVTFLPRKMKRKKRPNTIMSAFSVASTPVSQCTTLDSMSLLSDEEVFTPSRKRSPKSVIESGVKLERTLRDGVTPTREIRGILGGLSLGNADAESTVSGPSKRGGPFTSIKYNPSIASRTPSVLGKAQSGFNAGIYAPSQSPSRIKSFRGSPSIFSSVSQQSSQASTGLTYIVVAGIVFSLAANFAMFCYLYFFK